MKGLFKSPSEAFFTPYSSKNAYYESVDMAKSCSCKSLNLSSRERIKLFVKYQIGLDQWEPIMISIFKDLPISELKRKIIETLRSQIYNFKKPDQILLQFNGHRLPQSQIIENLLDSMTQLRAIPLISFNKRELPKNMPITEVPENLNEATTQESQESKPQNDEPLAIYSNQIKAKNYFSMFKSPLKQQMSHYQENQEKIGSKHEEGEIKPNKEISKEKEQKIIENVPKSPSVQRKSEQRREKQDTKRKESNLEKVVEERKEERESEEQSESESSSDEESVENKLEEAWGEKSSKVTQKQSVTSNEGSKRPRNLFV